MTITNPINSVYPQFHNNRKKYRLPDNVISLNIIYLNEYKLIRRDFMRVLFCTDGSKISFNALHNFAGWARDAVVDVISVIDWTFLPDGICVEEEGFASSCANMADNILDCVQKEIDNSNLTFGQRIKHCGEAVESILEQIKTENYDMVLMGSHGKKGLQSWLGSVSRDVINNISISSYISKETNCSSKILFNT